MKQHVAYIMRGIPGSGKSTVAETICPDADCIFSTDKFFEGEEFDFRKLSDYHQKNYEAFCGALKEFKPVVVCDNTNVKKADYKRYVAAANEAGYRVHVLTVEPPSDEVATERTIHGVPQETISRMRNKWQCSVRV